MSRLSTHGRTHGRNVKIGLEFWNRIRNWIVFERNSIIDWIVKLYLPGLGVNSFGLLKVEALGSNKLAKRLLIEIRLFHVFWWWVMNINKTFLLQLKSPGIQWCVQTVSYICFKIKSAKLTIEFKKKPQSLGCSVPTHYFHTRVNYFRTSSIAEVW